MKIKPKTLEEIAEKSLIKRGTYPCRVVAVRDDFSKSGAEMIVLTVSIFGPGGQVVARLTDRITENLAGGAKLRSFCEAFGMLEAYQSGELDTAECVNRNARCEVSIKRSKQYGDQNEILTYIAGPVLAAQREVVS